jgi:hypothetical protein
MRNEQNRRASPWAKCEERVPDMDVRVIVVCNGAVDTATRTVRVWHLEEADIWVDVSDNDEGVTHWMPLPEGPEDSKEA